MRMSRGESKMSKVSKGRGFKKLGLLAIIAIVALAMVACGSGSSDLPSQSGDQGASNSTPNTGNTGNTGDAGNAGSGDKVYKIGLTQYAPHPSLDNCRDGFILGLADEGFVEGVNVQFDITNADGKGENTNIIAQSYVAKMYDLICAIATPSSMAAQAAAEEKGIPVIFSAVSDPVAAQLVESLDQPNRGTTGTSDDLPLEKQMQLIREFLPEAKKIGILYTTSEVNSQTHLNKFKELAPKYNFEIVAIGVNTPSDIPLAVDSLLAQVDVVNNFTDNNVVNNLQTLIDKANEKRIPVFGSEEEQVKNGCIASESIDYVELGRATGIMAAQILKGQDVNTLPVQVITESKPVASQAVMDMLGIELPAKYKDTIEFLD